MTLFSFTFNTVNQIQNSLFNSIRFVANNLKCLHYQPTLAREQEGMQKENDKDKNSGSPYPNVPPGLVYTPQLFSDENPNACSVM
jgi:hypothetical protein